MVDCPQQRTAHEETLTEELFLEFVGTGSGRRAGGFGSPKVQQLRCVVPLVQRLVCIDALVALEADQLGTGHRRQHLRDLGFAHTRFTLEQQWALERGSEEDRRGQPTIGEIVVVRKRGGDRIDRRQRRVGTHGHAP